MHPNFYKFERKNPGEQDSGEDVSLKRKKNMQDSVGDILPVVELRPFSRHVWRRDRSLPDFYNKPPETNEDVEGRYPAHESLPNIVEVLTEITQSSNAFKDDGLKRMRTKLHPKIFNINAPPTDPKACGIVPSFITKDDRTKTTLFWSNQDENPKSYSCRKQALNSATVRRQQQIQLHGGPLSLPENLPNQFAYLNPLAYYKQRAMMKHRQSQFKHSSAPSDDRISGMRSLPGRELDIIRLLQRRSPKPRLSPIIKTTSNNDERETNQQSENTLAAEFSKNGRKATIIERQLDDEQNFYLRKISRTIDIGYTSLDLLHHLHNHTSLNSSLTQGEILLKKGKQANTTNADQEAPYKKVLDPVTERNNTDKSLRIRGCGADPVSSQTHKKMETIDSLTGDDSGVNEVKESSATLSGLTDSIDNDDNDSVLQTNDNKSNLLDGSDETAEPDLKESTSFEDEASTVDVQSDETRTNSKIDCFSRSGVVGNIDYPANKPESPYIDIVAVVNNNDARGSISTENTSSSPVVQITDNFEPVDDKDGGSKETISVSVSSKNINNDNATKSETLQNGDTSTSALSLSKANTSSNDSSALHIINSDISNEENCDNVSGIMRRPKVCAFDETDCVKHKKEDIVMKPANSDNGDLSEEYDTYYNSNLKDQQTQVDEAHIDGPQTELFQDVALLPSTTFLTTNI